ncbi:hypothetical protein EON67_08435 [archaeon]|nr:MAG: hypothetical protein EON67_08435 [archaeon]
MSCADPAVRRKRIAAGGNKKEMFTEGWIEFLDKKDAKRVVELLNNTAMGTCRQRADAAADATRFTRAHVHRRPCVPQEHVPCAACCRWQQAWILRV